MKISKNLMRAYLALCVDIWSRQRVLVMELNHIQHNCVELLGKKNLSEHLNRNTFYMYMDAVDLIESKATTTGNGKENNLLRQRHAKRLYFIAGKLLKEVLQDHIELLKIINGTTHQSKKNTLTNFLSEAIYDHVLKDKNLSILQCKFDSLIDEILSSTKKPFISLLKIRYGIETFLIKNRILEDHKEEIDVKKILECSYKIFKKKSPTQLIEDKNVCLEDGEIFYKKTKIRLENLEDYDLKKIKFFEKDGLTELFLDNKLDFDSVSLRCFYYSINILRYRVSSASHELGIMTVRVAELMRHENPSMIGIAGFQRQEYPYYDLFVRTYADRLLKDLLIFCKEKEFLGCPYPYDSKKDHPEVASLIHILTHKDQWELQPIVRKNHYEKWKNKTLNIENKEFCQEYGDNALALLNSFFLELPTNIPILTHEIGHHVIREFVGMYARPELFNDRKRHGRLGGFFRECHDVISRFTCVGEASDDKFIQTEIFADLIAVIRLGPSYIYAWFMEISPSPMDYEHFLDEFDQIDFELLTSVVLDDNLPFHDVLPTDYIRGTFMVEMAFAICNEREDSDGMDLVKALEEHLNLILHIRYRSEPYWIRYWKQLPYYARKAIYKSKLVRSARKFRRLFVNYKSKDQKENYDFSNKQHLSKDFQTEVYPDLMQCLYKKSPPSHNDKIQEKIVISEAIDIPWRVSWKAAKAGLRELFSLNSNGVSSQFNDISKHTIIENIAREDYMSKVMGELDIWNITDDSNTKIYYEGDEQKEGPIEIEKLTFSDDVFESLSRRPLLNKLKLKENNLSPDDINRLEECINSANGKKRIYIEYKSQKSDYEYRIPLVFNKKNSFCKDSSQLKVLELFRFSAHMNSDNLDKYYQRNMPKGHLSIKKNGEEKIIQGGTLGFYDYFVIHEYREKSGHVFRNDSYPFLSNLQAYKRRRVLVPFNIDNFKSENEEISGLILIRLKMRSLRLNFLAWISDIMNSEEEQFAFLKKVFLKIYVSQGWEDFVLLINREDQDLKYIDSISKAIFFIADNPLVEKTETIFTYDGVFKSDLIKNKKINLKFLVKARNNNEFIDYIEAKKSKYVLQPQNDEASNKVERSEVPISVDQLNGGMDFRISINTKCFEKKDIEDFYKDLHTNPAVQKVFTDVGFIV